MLIPPKVGGDGRAVAGQIARDAEQPRAQWARDVETVEGAERPQEGLWRDVLRLRRIARLEEGVAKDGLPMAADNDLPGPGLAAAGTRYHFGFRQLVSALPVVSHYHARHRQVPME
jgi:hypothetical protein